MDQKAMKLISYHLWANNQWFNHLDKLTEEQIYKEITSVFPSIKDTLVHMLKTDRIWLWTISGKTYDETIHLINKFSQELKDATLSKLESMFQEIGEDYKLFLGGVQDADQKVTISHPKFGEARVLIQDLLQHVVNHGTYHRGNLTAMLSQMGERGVPTDYIYYMYAETPLFSNN